MSVDATVAALTGAGGDNGKVLAWDATNQKWTAQAFTPTITAGSITNTMLASGIDASKITTGALPYAQLPVGTAANTVAAGDDSRITGALQKSGGTMSGDINMGSNKITAVANMPFAAAAPGAGQNGQTLVWNNGSGAWDWITPGVAGSGLQNFNGATGSTQSFATPGTSGTEPNWSTASNAHTLNIPMASAASVTAGLLSNSDYTTFSNKFSASSGGTITGNVTFSGTVSMPAFSMGGALNMASHAINGVTDPTLAQDAATKNYADTHIGGGSFATALTGNAGKLLTVNGTEDGFILSSAALGTLTGITTAGGSHLTGGGSSGTLSLSVSTGTSAGDIPVLGAGGYLAVAQGGTGAATTSGAAQVFAGPTGAGGAPSFRALVATDLPSGVIGTPGTYKSVTVDTYGRVTAGSNPTTLAGYGITDAAPSAGSSSITTVGTIGSGTWQGTAVGVAYGGTGLSSYTTGDILYASGATTIGKLADVATGSILVSGGVGAAPSWSSSLADSYLATISTSGKVANSATTAASTNTAGAIVARDANGDFAMRDLTARNVTLSGVLAGAAHSDANDNSANRSVSLAAGNVINLSAFVCDGTHTITLTNAVAGSAYTVVLAANQTGNACIFYGNNGSTAVKFTGGATGRTPTSGYPAVFTFVFTADANTAFGSMVDSMQ
jgi:hypothetical protein